MFLSLVFLVNINNKNDIENCYFSGARVRRMAFGNFACNLPDSTTRHTEVNLLCLTNMGDCLVLSIPDLKRQLNAAAIRREDIK